MSDVTNSSMKDPVQRMQKLVERRQHLEDSIAQKQDRHYLIESEIAECQKEICDHECICHSYFMGRMNSIPEGMACPYSCEHDSRTSATPTPAPDREP